MGTIFDVANSIQSFVGGFDRMIEDELKSDREDIEDFIQEQLYSGINGREKPLRPTYTNDPYFKEVTNTAKAAKSKAEGYKKYKKKKTPPTPSYLGYQSRDENTPNLIIRGDFYSSITAHVGGGVIKIGTEGLSFGNDIEKKYGSIIFGLSPKARAYLIEYRLKPAIKKYMEKYGLK